jgi:hypothetical protein
MSETIAGRPFPAPLRLALAGLALTLSAACAAAPAADAPVRLEAAPAGEYTRVTLIPAAHIKLNARLKPALELADGSVLRFDAAHLTADSAYFAEPPAALLPGRHGRVHGTLRASVCENDAPVCRALVLEL